MTLTKRQSGTLLFSILMVALCGIVYELIIATIGSYLLGNSVYQFSLTIGLFMFAMGVGSYLSRHLHDNLLLNFIRVEIIISIIGGISSLALFITFGEFRPLYGAVMYGLIIIIGTLVGIEIPLLTRILTSQRSFKDALADVFSLDYLGALIGSVAFPTLILPQLGHVRASFAIGLVNIAVALMTIIVFRAHLKRYSLLLGSSLLIALALIVAAFFATRITTYLEQQLYAYTIIHRTQSEYQRIVLTHAPNRDEHRLYIDGHLQFAESDEYRYHESLVHPVMAMPGERSRILILGGGDGLAAREVFKWPEVKLVDLVDIDPAITSVSRELGPLKRLNKGSLEDERLTLYHKDAFTFVQDIAEPYDRIIIDLPDPHNEALNKLYSREFYLMLRRGLGPEGILICQSSSPFVTRKTYWCIGTTMESAELNLLSHHTAIPSFGIWGFHMASTRKLADLAVDPLPKNLRYLSPDLILRSRLFPIDLSRVEVPPNTISHPHLYQLYSEELN